MRWEGREASTNVEDRRGIAPAGLAIGGGAGLILLILSLLTGQNFMPRGGQAPGPVEKRPTTPEEDRLAKFTAVVLKDTEIVWDELFRQIGREYRKPKLVLFSEQVSSACGSADAAVGPFYCPGDSQIYIDVTFYRDMERQLKAGGEFARAYVIAHEVGHHVQRLLGYSKQVDEARRRGSQTEANRMSVRLELQADYLAGVWAHHANRKIRNYLEPGDIESALNAAHQIGDDTLQKRGRGRVVPDSFTHGTSEQRARWFRRGFETGDIKGASRLFELEYNQL